MMRVSGPGHYGPLGADYEQLFKEFFAFLGSSFFFEFLLQDWIFRLEISAKKDGYGILSIGDFFCPEFQLEMQMTTPM